MFSKAEIYESLMHGPAGIELFHGYTYSGHPLACAAALASLEIFTHDGVLEHAKSVSYWGGAVQSLRGLPHVIDLRSIGLIAGIELESIPGKPGARV